MKKFDKIIFTGVYILSYAVIKSASYVLIHTPDMVINNGTTQTLERMSNPESEYLKNINDYLRSYDKVVSYPPNQVYIGNMTPDELKDITKPWYNKEVNQGQNVGKFGEILSQEAFIGLIKVADAFDLVLIESEFLETVKDVFSNHRILKRYMNSFKNGVDRDSIEKFIEGQGAEGIYNHGVLVGCVKKAHDIDPNLSAHVMYENLVVKASGIISFLNLIERNDIDIESIDYVIECSEEACGDMNQRGGGNFAKSIAESVGAINATGADLRGFCAAPTHSLIQGASLVKAGTYKNVVVVAGGATAKLGMNGKDHAKNDIPILEDVLGGFAILISENDGHSPILRTDLVGRHTVGTGSSPQAVITSLISAPLDKANLKVTDIDRYSVEMQNPDITKPAGAGDVPESNFKMIAAIGVKRGELERSQLKEFVDKHGMPGWAPTQGHIPSGVPYLGFCIDDLTSGNLNRGMIVGKGSLFLGRMTNLFDGVSIIVERNDGESENVTGVSKEDINQMIAKALKDFAAHLLEE
jgi:betaine reductase